MTQLKLIQPSKPRVGLYFRPGRNDHTTFLQLLSEDRAVSGVVLDARHLQRHRALREALAENGVHSVLDTDFMQLSTPGGSTLDGLAQLPWARFALASPADLMGRTGIDLAEGLATTVQDLEFSAILAPTHYLQAANDPYFGADRVVAGRLRAALDRRGLKECCVFYPLAMSAASLRSGVQRTLVVEGLRSVDVDAVWLRLHPFGTSTAGSLALRRYLDAAWELHAVGRPLVGEHTGTVGLALMAFGAVGGIESGVTFGEQFDARSLLRPRRPNARPFSPAPRVYLHEIASFADRKTAARLWESRRLVAALACRDAMCCPGGPAATLRDPRRHFTIQRTREGDEIGAVAPAARPGVFLRDRLQPSALLAIRVSRMAPELDVAARRLVGLHQTLQAVGTTGLPAPMPALGHRLGISRRRPQSL